MAVLPITERHVGRCSPASPAGARQRRKVDPTHAVVVGRLYGAYAGATGIAADAARRAVAAAARCFHCRDCAIASSKLRAGSVVLAPPISPDIADAHLHVAPSRNWKPLQTGRSCNRGRHTLEPFFFSLGAILFLVKNLAGNRTTLRMVAR